MSDNFLNESSWSDLSPLLSSCMDSKLDVRENVGEIVRPTFGAKTSLDDLPKVDEVVRPIFGACEPVSPCEPVLRIPGRDLSLALDPNPALLRMLAAAVARQLFKKSPKVFSSRLSVIIFIAFRNFAI